MKSGLKTIAVAVSLLTLAAVLRSEPASQLRPSNYVNDFAGVLDPTAVAQLNSLCQEVDEKGHAQIAVVTVKSLDGSDIESYAVALFKQWGIGSKSTDHGVLILLATQDHRYRIEVGYGLEPILPDGKVGSFGREAVAFLKQNDYNGAVSLMTERVADVIAQDAGVQLNGSRPRAPTVEQPDRGMSLGGIVVIIIIGLILLFTPFGRLILWGLLLGGRGGGWGGGGFGGGGAGGGFGGFGGGSSGGGGASGSW